VSGPFGFVPLSPIQISALLMIIALYVLATETAKSWFYRSRLTS